MHKCLWIGCCAIIVAALSSFSYAQYELKLTQDSRIDTMGFWDGAHHWYSITDEDKVITPLPDQKRYDPSQIEKIGDNILLYQKPNGGWPKNYDMLAILTDKQKEAIRRTANDLNTTFDNGATHSQVEYLAKAFDATKNPKFKEACLRGIDYMLSAQYENGGWPQFYPDTSGYRKYITFNDGAMTGVMEVFHRILEGKPYYSFVDSSRRARIKEAFTKGLQCIFKCQVVEHGTLTVWGQQHDNIDFRPQSARAFEPASLTAGESSEIVLLLMSIESPSKEIISSVQHAVQWFQKSQIRGIRVKEISAPPVTYKYHKSNFDRVVVRDSSAPPIWARLYELGTNRPLFCNRDLKVVYSLAEVHRERRTGYSWYTYAPEEVVKNYSSWQQRWAPNENVLKK
ncbi:MAG TPA: pectate lyase [Bacteroidota bacterium]|nr:pectate lyase [Bacteroidota bacterium]